MVLPLSQLLIYIPRLKNLPPYSPLLRLFSQETAKNSITARNFFKRHFAGSGRYRLQINLPLAERLLTKVVAVDSQPKVPRDTVVF